MKALSIYERLGGENALMAAVNLFYEKALADELVAPYFRALDMPAQVKKQMAFMAHAFGGPNEYKGRNLQEAHAQLVKNKGLNDAHFDRIAELLQTTLEELDIEPGLINEVMTTVAATRSQVLGG